MTKMLSWANADKFHVARSNGPYDRPKGPGGPFRRRNRAREAEAVRREIGRERAAESAQTWRERRSFDMNDEHNTPSNEVWRALDENDQGLRFVDFDGSYTVG